MRMSIDKQKLLDWVESEITESNETAMKWVAYNVMKGKFDAFSSERTVIKLVVYYSEDLGGHETEIVEIIGSFEPIDMADMLRTHHDGTHLKRIYDAVGSEDDTWWDVYAELSEVQPETQYGTGYGDILVLPGYYCIGKVLKVEKHPSQEEIEEPENEQN
jgi:hypothetical protein